MEGKILIEVYKTMPPEDFSKKLAKPESRLEVGSAAAGIGAMSAGLLLKAAGKIAGQVKNSERLEYILHNGEILRGYMVHLIDEDVKCRGPLRRALKDGGAYEIEASRQPAVAICGEIINMMETELGFIEELCAICPADCMHYLGEAMELAQAACASARMYIIDMSDKCTDDTYRYVVRRENEISRERIDAVCGRIRELVEKSI